MIAIASSSLLEDHARHRRTSCDGTSHPPNQLNHAELNAEHSQRRTTEITASAQQGQKGLQGHQGHQGHQGQKRGPTWYSSLVSLQSFLSLFGFSPQITSRASAAATSRCPRVWTTTAPRQVSGVAKMGG